MKKFFAAVFLCLLLSACGKKNVVEKLGWKEWGESIHYVGDITIKGKLRKIAARTTPAALPDLSARRPCGTAATL